MTKNWFKNVITAICIIRALNLVVLLGFMLITDLPFILGTENIDSINNFSIILFILGGETIFHLLCAFNSRKYLFWQVFLLIGSLWNVLIFCTVSNVPIIYSFPFSVISTALSFLLMPFIIAQFIQKNISKQKELQKQKGIHHNIDYITFLDKNRNK